MGQIREVDAISDAIIETEREIAGEAWGQEDTERDGSGRSLEEMGEGLEGQQEAEDADELEGEEAEGEEEAEGDGEDNGEKLPEVVAKEGEGEKKPESDPAQREPTRVPYGKFREANERARAAEVERDALKAELAKTGQTLEQKLDAVTRELAEMRRAPPVAPKAPEPPKLKQRPDLFENPDGVFDYLDAGVKEQIAPLISEIKNLRVENSMAIAHASHKDTFEKAFSAINQLNPQNPDDRSTVQRIYASPNPGEALVTWHRRNETLARVGNDPTAFEERIRTETREALMKDPEFLKQIVSAARGDAARGEDGQPRTTTRLPKSLHSAAGSNVGADRGEANQYDDSDSAVADAAWR